MAQNTNTQNTQNANNAQKPAAAVNGAAQAAANTVADTYTQMVDGFFAAQKKMLDTMMGFSATSFGVENPSFEAARTTASSFFHKSVEAGTQSMGDFGTIVNDQIKFAGRVAERSIDTLCGVNGAKSPEAFAATSRSIMTDCVENMGVVAQEMIKLSARNAETMQKLMSGATSSFASAFTGKGAACCSK